MRVKYSDMTTVPGSTWNGSTPHASSGDTSAATPTAVVPSPSAYTYSASNADTGLLGAAAAPPAVTGLPGPAKLIVLLKGQALAQRLGFPERAQALARVAGRASLGGSGASRTRRWPYGVRVAAILQDAGFLEGLGAARRESESANAKTFLESFDLLVTGLRAPLAAGATGRGGDSGESAPACVRGTRASRTQRRTNEKLRTTRRRRGE